MGTGGYDGEVVFKTKIDDEEFNKGVKNLSSKINVLGASFKSLGQAMGGMFGKVVQTIGTIMNSLSGLGLAILGVAAVALLAFGGIVAVMAGSIRSLFEIDGYAQGLKDSLAQLKVSFATAFEPLVTMALPYIQMVVEWFIKLFNTIQMIIAAWLGQKTVMQATANTTKDAAKSAGQLAKNTKDAGKAAEGALASFDELNVLQMNKNEDTTGGGGGNVTGPAVTFTSVPIDPKILENVANIQQSIENIKNAYNQLSFSALKTLNEASITAQKIVLLAEYSSMSILNDASITSQKILLLTQYKSLEILNEASISAQKLLLLTEFGLMNTLNEASKTATKILQLTEFNLISILNSAAITAGQLVTLAQMNLTSTGENIKNFFIGIWNTITQLWFLARWWFSTFVTEPIKSAFKDALGWIQDKWETTFNNIKGFVRNTINSIIDLLNGMISGTADAFNSVIGGINSINISPPEWWTKATGMGSWSPGLSPVTPIKIPHLATGAVIPPNAQFAAILGDQKRGTNIEAPEDLIRQIVREEMGGQQSQRITIDFGNSSLGALIRVLNPVIKQENDRIRSSLIDGVSA
jgi:hypothetical protein